MKTVLVILACLLFAPVARAQTPQCPVGPLTNYYTMFLGKIAQPVPCMLGTELVIWGLPFSTVPIGQVTMTPDPVNMTYQIQAPIFSDSGDQPILDLGLDVFPAPAQVTLEILPGAWATGLGHVDAYLQGGQAQVHVDATGCEEPNCESSYVPTSKYLGALQVNAIGVVGGQQGSAQLGEQGVLITIKTK